jgi:EmrB/QacA subfamily drug resistance transporter
MSIDAASIGTSVPSHLDGDSPRSRLVILVTCCLALVLTALDATIVNIALPAIRSDLHASVAELQWSIDAYTVIVASFLLLAGSIADRFGRRKTFQAGLLVFSIGSLLCSVAPNARVLVLSRALQAVGGSMLNPVAMSIIVNTFLDPKERARAVGIWGAAFGVAMAAGPLLGGLLVQSVGWRSIFWVNIPLGVVALALTARFVRESRAERARRFDPLAQLLVIAALFALTSTVIDGRHAGWTSWPIVVGFATAIACAVGLVAWESRHHEPMLDPRFFRSFPFAAATLVAVLAFAAFSGFLFLNSLYLQESRGMSASQAGFATLPIALALMVCSPLSGRLVGAGRARIALVLAGAAMATGALLLTTFAPPRGVRHLWHRPRHGKCADHQHRRVGHAPVTCGDRIGRRIHEPAGGRFARRRARRFARGHRDRIHTRARLRRRNARLLLGQRWARHGNRRARDCIHRYARPRERLARGLLTRRPASLER